MAKKTGIPEDFTISTAVRSWAKGKGWERFLEAYLEIFKDYCLANDAKYANWDAAFRNCIRMDWGKVRGNAHPAQKITIKKDDIDWETPEQKSERMAGAKKWIEELTRKFKH